MLIEAMANAPVGLILGSLGTQELLIILVIALVFFGGRKIPEIFRGFGEGIREFKSSMKEEDEKPATSEKPEEVKSSS
jgi:sec-independent protein translocase protein TatA